MNSELTGSDQTNSARYHPLYITDSFEGGFGQKTPEQQREQKVYAGVSFDAEGFPIPSAGKMKGIKTMSSDLISFRLNSWKLVRMETPDNGQVVGIGNVRGLQKDADPRMRKRNRTTSQFDVDSSQECP